MRERIKGETLQVEITGSAKKLIDARRCRKHLRKASKAQWQKSDGAEDARRDQTVCCNVLPGTVQPTK